MESDEGQQVVEAAEGYVRYAEESTPAASTLESEAHSGAPEISFKSGMGVSFCEDSILDFHRDDDKEIKEEEESNNNINSNNDGDTLAITDDNDKLHEPTLVQFVRSSTPSTGALCRFSSSSRVGSLTHNWHRDRRGSVHFITLSSATSDGTIIDHGAACDQVRTQTPDRKKSYQKDLVQAYLSQSAKERNRCLVLQSGKNSRKLSTAIPPTRPFLTSSIHEGGVLKNNHNNSITSRVVHNSYSGIDISISCNNNNNNKEKNHTKVHRASSCPVNISRVSIPSISNDNYSHTISYFQLEQRSSSSVSSTAQGGKSAIQQKFSDEMRQYRLAVENAKKRKYALSIRELLANQCDDGDEEEEEEDDDDDEDNVDIFEE